MSMFEKASKRKLRFVTMVLGSVSVEDLWDLPLTSVQGASLDGIAIALHEDIENNGKKSFVNAKSSVDYELELKFNIIKRVIEVKMQEAKDKLEAADRKEKKERLMSLIAQKQNEAEAGKSLEELEEMLKEI